MDYHVLSAARRGSFNVGNGARRLSAFPLGGLVARAADPLSNREWLDGLEPAFERIRVIRRVRATHLACARASTVKSYELLRASYTVPSESVFFIVPSLRSLCEELIFLRFMKRMPATDRNDLVRALLEEEFANGVELQQPFLARWARIPPLRRAGSAPDAAQRAQDIWRRYGWPKLKSKALPQVRQVAERGGDTVLRDLYDFLYALTSSSVHFGPRTLLRLAWGTDNNFSISTAHLSSYYLAVVRVYGTWLLCGHFETFGHQFRLRTAERDALSGLREWMLQLPRWPEHVTPEELNHEPRSNHILIEAVLHGMRAKLSKRRLL